MHTVHYPNETKNGFIAAAMGVMFSVDNYNVNLTEGEQMVIDTFFETLRWDQYIAGAGNWNWDSVVDLVAYGDLMNLVNFNNRWIYKGSVTTPPCATNVYWNVLSTVYPVKQKYVDEFVNYQLAKVTGLKTAGNWREVQKIDGQDVRYVKNGGNTFFINSNTGSQATAENKEEDDDSNLQVGILVIMIITLLGMCCIGFYFHLRMNLIEQKNGYFEKGPGQITSPRGDFQMTDLEGKPVTEK